MNWWVSTFWEISPIFLVSWVFWIILSICLHELSHGLAAIRLGDDTPIMTGHMTWNPLVHMGKTALIMFAIFGFTWGAMPYSPHRLRGRYAEAVVAFAGPMANAAIFTVLMLVLIPWEVVAMPRVDPVFAKNMATFLWIGSVINLLMFCFNLIPIPPLDGSRIIGDFFPQYNELWRGERGAVIGLVAFMGLFFFGGRYVFGLAFVGASFVRDVGVDLLSRVV